MFNNKDTAKSTPNGSNHSPALNMISEGTRLKGDLNSQNDIRIAGRLTGEAVSKGKIILTSSGKIEGNIKAKDADIAGKLEGELFINGKLTLRQTAVIDGNIHTKTLLVEEGAQINGSFKMSSDEKQLSGSADTDFATATQIKKSEAAD
ncbi:MAG: polymer-forming cytoskeletal protein [Balneolaceae bacterium]